MGQTGGVTVNGYIKLFRSLMDWEWYQDANVMRVFLHLLLDCNHKTQRWQGKEIYPGQTVTSRQKIAEGLGISEQQVRTALTKLKSTGEITSKSTNKYTLITIDKWTSYQSADDVATSKITTDPTNHQPTDNQQITTNKNDKKERSIYSMQKPSVDDVKAYCLERKNGIDPQRFVDYYEANGWMVGRNKMKDWQAAVRNWEKRGQEEVKPKKYVN